MDEGGAVQGVAVEGRVPVVERKAFSAHPTSWRAAQRFAAEVLERLPLARAVADAALAVTSKERNPALPEVPTVIESGLKGFEVVGFYGFLAPTGTPKEVVATLSDALKQVLNNPDVRNRMVTQGADPAFLGNEEFAKFLAAETPRWAAAVKASGAKLD